MSGGAGSKGSLSEWIERERKVNYMMLGETAKNYLLDQFTEKLAEAKRSSSILQTEPTNMVEYRDWRMRVIDWFATEFGYSSGGSAPPTNPLPGQSVHGKHEKPCEKCPSDKHHQCIVGPNFCCDEYKVWLKEKPPTGEESAAGGQREAE